MNYLNIYNNLITRSSNRGSVQLHTEMHHIIPRCLGGNNDVSNLVKLTPEEHYLAHQLLVKIYPDNYKLIHAATMMCCYNKAHGNRRLNNKLYGWLRRRLSIAAKVRSTGESNSQYGTCWVHNVTLQKSKKIPKDMLQEFLDNGWTSGRVMNFNKPVKLDKRQILKDETNARYLQALLSSSSISEALRSLGLQTRGAGYARMKNVILENNLQHKFAHDYINWNSKH